MTTPNLEGVFTPSTTDSIQDASGEIGTEDSSFGFIILGVFLGVIAILVVGCLIIYTNILSFVTRIFKKKKYHPPGPIRSAYFIEDAHGSPTITRSHLRWNESRQGY